MATTHLLSLCDPTSKDSPALVLLFPDRVHAPTLDAHRKAVALAAATGHGGTFRSANLREGSGRAVVTPYAFFPCGSWMVLPTTHWDGWAETALVFDQDTLEGVADGPIARSSFFLPDLCTTQLHPLLAKPSLWRDSAPAAVVVGALDALGSVPFGEASFAARVNPSWLYGLLVVCARNLHPWLGDKRIPIRGYDARPFPQQTTQDRAERALLAWFASPDTDAVEAPGNKAHGFVQHLVRAKLLVPDAPYAPKAWTLGQGWDAFRDGFPPALVEAGRRCAPFLSAFDDRSMEDLDFGMPDGLTAHARARWNAPFFALAHVLTSLDASYLRPSVAKKAAVVQRIRERA